MTDQKTTLSASEKKALKARAHPLSPVVMIGENGLTPSVLKEIEASLQAHELIKVKVAGDARETRLQYAQEIVEQTQCALVQHIGKLLVLYRHNPQRQADAANGEASKTGKPKNRGKRLTKRQVNAKG